MWAGKDFELNLSYQTRSKAQLVQHLVSQSGQGEGPQARQQRSKPSPSGAHQQLEFRGILHKNQPFNSNLILLTLSPLPFNLIYLLTDPDAQTIPIENTSWMNSKMVWSLILTTSTIIFLGLEHLTHLTYTTKPIYFVNWSLVLTARTCGRRAFFFFLSFKKASATEDHLHTSATKFLSGEDKQIATLPVLLILTNGSCDFLLPS